MSKFLALIVAVAMAFFLAGQAVAGEFTVTATEDTTIDVTKEYNKEFSDTVTRNKDITIEKDFTVDASADAEIGVDADVIFKELDVQLLEDESVIKFFELDDFAKSVWHIQGEGLMNVAEQFQAGPGNTARIVQNPFGAPATEMNVGLQYQIGGGNFADLLQGCHHTSTCTDSSTNNFAKQVQLGDLHTATILQH